MFRPRKQDRRRMVRRVPRPIFGGGAITLTRSSQPVALTLVAGTLLTNIKPTLNDVDTTDLLPVFREYRVLKVIATFTKRIDPGNAGFTNIASLTQIATANDPEGSGFTTFREVTSYSNAKRGTLTADRYHKYSFHPKVINSVSTDTLGTVGSLQISSVNPWIMLTASGVAVRMNQLQVALLSTLATDVSVIEYVLDYVFQVRGMA